MGEWRARYADKVVSAEEAIRGIPPGRRILIGSGAAEPVSLVKAMVEKGTHLADNEVVHLLTLGPAPYVEPANAGRFRHIAFFIGANVRSAVQEGRADFMPVFLSEIPELIRSRPWHEASRASRQTCWRRTSPCWTCSTRVGSA
jgi:acyl-CoA hydrolase